jgi:hypothetical protein
MGSIRHAGLEEPAPHLIRGHPEGLESTGFPDPSKLIIGRGMTTSYENRSL